MKSKILACGLILLLVLMVTACAPFEEGESESTEEDAPKSSSKSEPPKETPKEETVVEPAEETPEVEETPVEEPVEETTEEVEEEEVAKSYNDDVGELVSKGKEVTSYNYYMTTRIKDSYGNYQDVDYKVFINGDMVLKEYLAPIESEDYPDFFYNKIFFTMGDSTAKVICDDNTVVCDLKNKTYRQIPYSREKIYITPVDLLDVIPEDAEVEGKEVIDNRMATIVKFVNEDGMNEKVSIDNYYGVPLKRLLFEENEADFEEKVFYYDMGVGNTQINEVTMPTGYDLVE